MPKETYLLVCFVTSHAQDIHGNIYIRIAELMEKETEAYLKMDPDPFDDRHPGNKR